MVLAGVIIVAKYEVYRSCRRDNNARNKNIDGALAYLNKFKTDPLQIPNQKTLLVSNIVYDTPFKTEIATPIIFCIILHYVDLPISRK